MATLREIRKQLRSVENIEKITQAMEMVAAARLRKAQYKLEMARPYSEVLRDILINMVSSSLEFNHPLLKQKEVKKVGIVIIAGDRGLCGSYNHTVFSRAEKELRKYSTEQVELFLFGKKTIDYFSRKKWHISEKISDWGGKISYEDIKNFANNLISQFLNGNLDEIWMIYTHFITAATRKVVIEKLLNLELPSPDKELNPNFIFEPSVEKIFAELLPRYMVMKVQLALYDAYASELAARIFSMRAATKNAEEMIEQLTLVRNKIRQASITTELITITSCAESLK